MNRLSLRIPSFNNSSAGGASMTTSKVSDLRAKFEDPSAVPAPLSLKNTSQAHLVEDRDQKREVGDDCASNYSDSEEKDLVSIESPVDETLASPWEYAEFITTPFSATEEDEIRADSKKQSQKSIPQLSAITKKEKETEQQMLDRVAQELEQQHERIKTGEAAALKAFEDLALSELRFE